MEKGNWQKLRVAFVISPLKQQILNYLKTNNKFYEDISISEGLSTKEG